MIMNQNILAILRAKSADFPSFPFWAISASILVFREIPFLKVRIFSEHPKH